MKAEIIHPGILVITPETETESFALRQWEEKKEEPLPKDPRVGSLVTRFIKNGEIASEVEKVFNP